MAEIISLDNLKIVPNNYNLLIMEDLESLRRVYDGFLDFFNYAGDIVIAENVSEVEEKLGDGFVPQIVLSDVLEGSFPKTEDYATPLARKLKEKIPPFVLMHTSGSYDPKEIHLEELGSLGMLHKGIGGLQTFNYSLAVLASAYKIMETPGEKRPEDLTRWHSLTKNSLSNEVEFYRDNFKKVLGINLDEEQQSLEERAKREVEKSNQYNTRFSPSTFSN